MWKLMCLEWKKHDSKKYVINAVIVLLVLGVFLFAQCYLGIANDPETGVPDAASEMTNNISSQIDLLAGACYLVFAGVMMATFIVSACKDKIINVMFSYPIRRKKLMLSSMLSVWSFNFIALLLTKYILYVFLFMMSKFMTTSFPVDYDLTSPYFYIELVFQSFLIVSLSFISLLVGRIANSSKVTVIMSFVLFFLLNGTMGDFTLAGNMVFQIILLVIAFICAAASMVGLEKKDVK